MTYSFREPQAQRAVENLRHNSLSSLDVPNIRKKCIEACLQAMVEERRFAYTDMFILGAIKR